MKFVNADTILKTAQKQREDIARKLYDYAAVQAAIKQAATEGLNSCRILQDTYVNLRATDVADDLVLKLKNAGYTCEWVEATQKENVGKRDSIVFVVYHELLISWGQTLRRFLGSADNA